MHSLLLAGNQFIPINQNHNGCDERKTMEEDDEITKEGEDADEEDEEEEDTKLTIEEEPGQPVKNKRKNFQPRSIVTDEVNRLEKNRRKGATTPQKCLSYRESETDSDTSEKTVNLKTFRKTPNKCHVDRGSLLSLLNSDNRLNNPFGIDLSKFTRPGSAYGEVLAGMRKSEVEGAPVPQPGANHPKRPLKPDSNWFFFSNRWSDSYERVRRKYYAGAVEHLRADYHRNERAAHKKRGHFQFLCG